MLCVLLLLPSIGAFQPSKPSFQGPSLSRLSYTNTLDDHATAATPSSSYSPAAPTQESPRHAVFDNIFEAPSLYAINVLLKHSRRENALAIFRYHAPYCRACQKVAPKFERLARRQADINFIQVPVSSKNPEKQAILDTMEVPSIPWGQVWHPIAGIVEELSLNPKYFDDFCAIVKSYQQGYCLLPEETYLACGVYAAPYYRKERDPVNVASQLVF